jgi:type III restriction enzyme
MLYPRLRIAKDLFTDDGVIFISIDDTVAVILKGISPAKFALYRHNPEEFISKVIRLINEEKAIMIVDDITYNETDGTHDSSIFTAEKNKDFSRACLSKKNVQDYVFADGTAKNP